MIAANRTPAKRFWRIGVSALLLLMVIAGAWLHRPHPTHPLPQARKVVLLIVPSGDAATFDNALRYCPWGVFPTRTDATTEALSDPLAAAAEVIATGDRTGPHVTPPLTTVLSRGGMQIVTLTNGDTFARIFAGQPRPDPLDVLTPAWQQRSFDFPDSARTDPLPFANALHAVALAAEAKPTLVAATFDDFYRADQYAPLALPQATAAHRRDALDRFNVVIDALTNPSSPAFLGSDVDLLVIEPVAARDAALRGERLGRIALWTAANVRDDYPFALTSASTRQTRGLIAQTDIAATIVALLGGKNRVGDGRPARIIEGGATAPPSVVLNRWDQQAREQSLLIYVPWTLAALLIAATVLSAWKRVALARLLLRATLAFPAMLIASAVFSAILPTDPIALYVVAAILSVLVAAALRRAPREPVAARFSFGALGAFAALLLVGDLATGGHLLARTPLSYSVMEAARFYGIGNEGAGVLIGSSLLAASAFFDPADLPPVALFAAAVSLALGLPMLGAKAGSFAGALIAFGVWILYGRAAQSGQRPGPAALGTLAAGIVGIFAAYALWDATRGAQAQSHVGVAMVGIPLRGIGSLFAIIQRKMTMEAHLIATSPWSVLLVTEIVLGCTRIRAHAARFTAAERAHILSFAAAGLALVVLNDAGVVGAALCLLYAFPLLLFPDASKRTSRNIHQISDEAADSLPDASGQ